MATERALRVVVDLRNVGGKGDKICYKFQKGTCDKGKKCPFKHVKDDKSRTQSPRRTNTRSPSSGNKDDKGKNMSKEEMAKDPMYLSCPGKVQTR